MSRAGALIWESVPRHVSWGRNELVQAWLGRFPDDRLAAEPRLALAAAHSHLAAGDLEVALRYASAVQRAVDDAPRGPSTLERELILLRAALATDGVVRMRDDATLAYELEPEDSPWRAACCAIGGVAFHLTGEPAAAAALLEEGAWRGAVAAPAAQTLCLAQLALLAAEEEDW